MQHLFFDTETTGLPKNYNAPVSDSDNWPRLVQIAWLIHDDETGKVETSNVIIKPEGFEIPKEASDVHGITTEKAMDEGKDLVGILGAFAEDISKSQILVGHNISFDRKIMGAEYYRKEMGCSLSHLDIICTMQSSTKYCELPGPYGYKWPKLQELHKKLFGLEFEDAHDALADIEATAKCYWELKKLNVI